MAQISLSKEKGVVIYAGFWLRALALLVDLIVWVPLVVLLVAAQGLSIPVAIVAQAGFTILGFAYPVYFLSRWGQTIGKMVAGIKVTRQDGAPVRSRHAWLRSSVDIGLATIYLIAFVYVLATWAGPDWSSLNWRDRGGELAKRTSLFTVYDWVSEAWMWSELVVLLLNKRRRALHDFIAGTVVVEVRGPRETVGDAPPSAPGEARRHWPAARARTSGRRIRPGDAHCRSRSGSERRRYGGRDGTG